MHTHAHAHAHTHWHTHTHRFNVNDAPGDDSVDVAAITDDVSIVVNLLYANVVDAHVDDVDVDDDAAATDDALAIVIVVVFDAESCCS